MEVSTTFSIQEINEQTKRILSFPMFSNSPVLSRFLEFIISETIHKKEVHIKEYAIAINVLYRAHDFNPNVDSIVRIHAGRLRRALTDYYLTQGIYDTIVIRIPKGCYVPEFLDSGTVNTPSESLPSVTSERMPSLVHQSTKPLVAIFPFRVAAQREGITEFLLVLKEQLSEELLRLRNISVIGYYSLEMNEKIKDNILEAGKSTGADYIITGSITYIGKRIRVLINLLVTGTGEVLLSKSFDNNSQFTDLFEIKDDIFQNLVGFAGDCYGSIFQQWQRHFG